MIETGYLQISKPKNKEFLFINEDYAKKNNLNNNDEVKIKTESDEFKLSVLISENIDKNSFITYFGTKTASILELSLRFTSRETPF